MTLQSLFGLLVNSEFKVEVYQNEEPILFSGFKSEILNTNLANRKVDLWYIGQDNRMIISVE